MKRKAAIRLFGSVDNAAHWLRMKPHAIHNWPVDDDDNLTSRRACDAVLAGLVRKGVAEGELKFGPNCEAAELLTLP